MENIKNTNDDDKYQIDTSKHQDGNESVDNPGASDTSLNDIFINTTK